MSTPTIDAGAMVDGVVSGVTDGVNDNLTTIGLLAGTMLAIGVVWRLASKASKPKG